jgi:hypothetical protein
MRLFVILPAMVKKSTDIAATIRGLRQQITAVGCAALLLTLARLRSR